MKRHHDADAEEDPGSATKVVRRDLLALLLLGLLLLSSGIGLRDPWPADEPRFALIAQEMVGSGDWLFPRRAAQLYAEKPPLFMWSIALVYGVMGSMRLAFLLPSLLAGLITLALVYDLGRRLWHRRAALAAGLTLLTVVQFTLQAKTAQIDASLMLWTTLGLYGLCRHLLLGPAWKFWYLAWFSMGLGIITKGVGFLPMLAIIPWYIARKRKWHRLTEPSGSALRWLLGPCLLVAAVGLWLVPMLLAVQESGDAELVAYRDEILWGQTVERYAAFEGHQHAVGYYPLQVIPTLWLPVSLLLPWLLPAWWRRLKRADARYLVLLGWVALVVLFFTLSSGKRGVYILPATPALALACGPLVAARLDRLPGVGRLTFGLLLFLALVFLSFGTALGTGAEWAREALRHGIEPAGFLFVLGAVGLFWAILLRPRRGLMALAGFLGSFWLLYGWWGYPLLDPARSSSVLMREVSEQLPPDAELAMVGWKEQMILHADRPVTHWGYLGTRHRTDGTEEQMRMVSGWLGQGSQERLALVPTAWLEPCFAEEDTFSFGKWHGHRWVLIDTADATGACQGGVPSPGLEIYRTAPPTRRQPLTSTPIVIRGADH
jgi:4-amino-4-deoxy-L-arabinose transferase-like glycosyltransferase